MRSADGPILILAPRGRDAAVIEALLLPVGSTIVCADGDALIEALDRGAGAAVIAEEALDDAELLALGTWVRNQPPWSDFPVVLLAERGKVMGARQAVLLETLGNVTLLERPLHPTTLVAASRAALRGRRRQRESERHLLERDRAARALRQSERRLKRLAMTLEERVDERTEALATANRRLEIEIEERRRTEAILRRTQRLEAVGQLTSGVAHDFNNLLTAVLGNLELVQERARDEAMQRLLRSAIRAAERGARLTEQLLAFSRKQRLTPKPVQVNHVLRDMAMLLGSTIGARISIEMDLAPQLWPALVDPTQIELVILNLAINARDAMPLGGTLAIRTQNATLPAPANDDDPAAGEYVTVTVSDTGSGMPPEVLARAFEPFFTTKEPGKGSGLGLSMVYGVARQSGGTVRIESRHGEGTSVRVILPRALREPAPPPAEPQRATPQPEGEDALILLVDDDADVREVAAMMLEQLGYRVVEAGNGSAALDILERRREVALLLVDFAMPGMSGVEVAALARERRPGLPVIFATGYADTTALTASAAEDEIVKKPFRAAELAGKVARAMSLAGGENVVPLRQPRS